MLGLITGTPREGKTLFAVSLIKKQIDANEKARAEGREDDVRPLYSTINDLVFEEVEIAPDDWRELPNRSVVFYDEAQKQYEPDGTKRPRKGYMVELEEHGHKGLDIYLITQDPTFIHAHTRKLVGYHWHVVRVEGQEASRIYRQSSKVISNVESDTILRRLDSEYWPYPKELYGTYRSAHEHSDAYKSYVPAWLKKSAAALIVSALIIGFSATYAWDFFIGTKTGFQDNPDVGSQHSLDGSDTAPRLAVQETPEHTLERAHDGRQFSMQRVGCISTRTKCHCYDNAGWMMEFEYHECKNTIFKPFSNLGKYEVGEISYQSSDNQETRAINTL